jgi:mono/diheme cytochrome c family protein
MTRSRHLVVSRVVASAVVALLAIAPLVADEPSEENDPRAADRAEDGEDPLAADQAEDAAEPTYTVVDGNADADTVQGYLVYTAQCMPCHGPDGVGSSFAPSLMRAAERRTFAQFVETVRDGRSLLPGQVMPPFGDNETVMAHVDDIWRYLNARADGALGRGRPQVLETGAGN